MGRLLAMGALLAAGYLVLSDSGGIRLSTDGGGSGVFSTYSGASKPAISGIANAAG